MPADPPTDSSAASPDPRPPLSGLVVADLSTGIAGAYAAKVLADLGAAVTAVEPPGRSPLRRRSVGVEPLAEGEDAPLWRHLRALVDVSTAQDPTDPRDPEVAAVLDEAQLVLADHAVATADPLIGWQGGNPDRIVVSISPYGLDGPWADRPATGFTVEVDSGAVDRRGMPPRPPVPVGGELVDWLTGSFAALGALSAWAGRVASGSGQVVDVSMLEAAVACLNGPYRVMSAQWFPGRAMPRAIEVPSIEPAADGPVGFCTQTAQQWSDFCALIGRPDLCADPAFNQSDARMVAIDTIRPAIAAYCQERTVDEIVEIAAAMRIPVTPVGTGATVWQFDQLADRGVYEPDATGLRRPRPPYRFSHTVLAGDVPRPDAPVAAPEVSRPVGPQDPPERPFAGLRVLDLTAFWAGPIATQYLGALGADVIKIESIQRPDGIRFLGSFDLDAPWERSFVFHGVNTDKRSVTLDLATDDGRRAFDRLLEGADVLIENFTPRVLENFGLRWEDLHSRHPELVMVRMPAFGLDGPWRDRAGFAMTIEQTSGLAWTTGYDDLPLVPRGPCDPIGGVHAVIAIHAALLDRTRTGEGQHIEVPLLEVACNIAAESVLEHSVHGTVLDRATPPANCPKALVACAGEDQWLGLEITDDHQWAALWRVLAGDDASLASAGIEQRRHRRREIDELIAAWAVKRDAADAEAELRAAGIPTAVMRSSGDIVDHPQMLHREVLQPFEHPITGEAGYPNFPMRFSQWGPHLLSRRPPLLGEHTREVLAESGYDEAALDDMEHAGIIGTRPAWL